MNLCSVRSVDLFLLLMKPVELTSNEFTVHLLPVMSVIRCEYFCIPLVNVHSHWEGQFIDVQDFLVIVKNDNVRFEVGDRCTSQL